MVSRLPFDGFLWLAQRTGFSGSDITAGFEYEFGYEAVYCTVKLLIKVTDGEKESNNLL